MPSSAGNDSSSPQGGVRLVGVRLGGVRADFVANLGKRLADLHQFRDALVEDPASVSIRDELRRHLHALATRARVLHFTAMVDRLERMERRLERAATAGGIDADDITGIDELLKDLMSLAWSEVGQADEPHPRSNQNQGVAPTSSQYPPAAAFPFNVLVIGRATTALALKSEADDGLAFDVELTDKLHTALELTQAIAPDVVVLDGDIAGATAISESLARDPITQSTPVIVVGTWSQADQAAAFLAHGVARTLPKPVSPAKLRQCVHEVISVEQSAETAADIGSVTVEQLAERLAEQVRTGLIDAVRPESRSVAVDLQQGTEVLAAVWSAVARVREMLTILSQGTIRFDNTGPVGAVPIAPWLDVKSGDDARRHSGGRETTTDAAAILRGRRVLVVDDDPAVTWFLSGLFRAHGSVVKEALDGEQGLALAFRFNPDLVITDILMPKLDGFGLCRALKRDVLLRDVPIILLSWKEDLLQRVRELGVGADGYLRKEATSAAILRTVQEALLPRTRVEQRLGAGGSVRGRLDGLTANTLLSLVDKNMPDASITVRDAHHLFEVQMRQGRIRDATRTALDGATVQGNEVLISLVHVFTGRFHVAPSQLPAGRMDVSVSDVVSSAVAEARAAQSLLEGPELARIERVVLRLDRIALDSLPDATQSVYRSISNGTAPKTLIEDGTITSAALAQLLSHAATRGAVAGVRGKNDEDLLTGASKRQLQSALSPLTSRPPPKLVESDAPTGNDGDDSEARMAEPQASLAQGSAPPDLPPASSPSPVPVDLEPIPLDLDSLADRAPPKKLEAPGPAERRTTTDMPTSLTEAVIREVADVAGSGIPPSERLPAMLDASELRPRRSANPEVSPLPWWPADAIVPGTESIVPDASGEPSVPGLPSYLPPPDIEAKHRQYEPDDRQKYVAYDPGTRAGDQRDHGDPQQSSPRAYRQSVSDEEYTLPKRSHFVPISAFIVVALGVFGAAAYFGGGAHYFRGAADYLRGASVYFRELAVYFREADPTTPPAPQPSADAAGPEIANSAPPVSSADLAPSAAPTLSFCEDEPFEQPGQVEEGLEIESVEQMPADQGLLEVVTGHPDAFVSINGRDINTGENIMMVLVPGTHHVNVIWQAKQLQRRVEVAAGKRTRLSLEDAWGP